MTSMNEPWGELSVLRGPRRANGIPLGGDRTFVYGFVKNKITFGRSTKSDVRISKEQCSRKHASIERVGNEVILTDIAMGGRMTVNGKKMTELKVKLHDWTGFSICDRHFMVRLFGAPVDPEIEPYLPKLPEPSRPSMNTTASTVDTTVASPDKSTRLSVASDAVAGSVGGASRRASSHGGGGRKRKLYRGNNEGKPTKRRLYSSSNGGKMGGTNLEDSIFMTTGPTNTSTGDVFEGNSVIQDEALSNSGWITNSADKIKLFEANMKMNAEWDAMGAEIDFDMGQQGQEKSVSSIGRAPSSQNRLSSGKPGKQSSASFGQGPAPEETPSFIADTSSIVASGTPPGIDVTGSPGSPCRSPVALPNPDKQRSVLKSSLPNTLQRASTKSVRFRAFYQVAEIDAGSRSVTPAHHAVPPHLRQQQRQRFVGNYDFNALLNEGDSAHAAAEATAPASGEAGLELSIQKSPGLSKSQVGLRLVATPDRVPVFTQAKPAALVKAESIAKNHCNHAEKLPPIVDAVDHMLRLPSTRANNALLAKLDKLNKAFLDLKEAVISKQPESEHREKILEAMQEIDLNAPEVGKLKDALCSISTRQCVGKEPKSPGQNSNLFEAIKRLQSGEAPEDFRNYVLRLLNAPAVNLAAPELEYSPRTNRMRAIGDIDRMFKHMKEITRKPKSEVTKEAPRRLRHGLRRILEAPKAQKIIATLCEKLNCTKEKLPEAAELSLENGLRALRAHPEWFAYNTPELRNMAVSCILELLSTSSANLPGLLLSSSRELNMYTPSNNTCPDGFAIINGISNLMAKGPSAAKEVVEEKEDVLLEPPTVDVILKSPVVSLPASKPSAASAVITKPPAILRPPSLNARRASAPPALKKTVQLHSPGAKGCMKRTSLVPAKTPRFKMQIAAGGGRKLRRESLDKLHISFEGISEQEEEKRKEKRGKIKRQATPAVKRRDSLDFEEMGDETEKNTKLNERTGPVKIMKFYDSEDEDRQSKLRMMRKGTPAPKRRKLSDGWGNATNDYKSLQRLQGNTQENGGKKKDDWKKKVMNTPHVKKGWLNVSDALVDPSMSQSFSNAASAVKNASFNSFRMVDDGLTSMGSDGFAVPSTMRRQAKKNQTEMNEEDGSKRKALSSLENFKPKSIEDIMVNMDKAVKKHWADEVQLAKPPFSVAWLKTRKMSELRDLCVANNLKPSGRRVDLQKALLKAN